MPPRGRSVKRGRGEDPHNPLGLARRRGDKEDDWRDLDLRDGLEEDEGGRARLVYPFASAPAPGAAVDVAPGVKWMRMPLGGPLAFINVWALKDGKGWAIVDTGMQTR